MTEILDVSRHPTILKELARTHPNTILILKSHHLLKRYTCAMYAFDFTERPEYVEIAEYGPFAGRDFVHWLLDGGQLEEISAMDAGQGDLAIYFSQTRGFEHIGIKRSIDRVASKWGTGHLYEHGLFEIPESYGTVVRFFKPLTFEAAIGHFKKFATDTV